MSGDVKTHRQSASELGSSALDTMEKATDVGFSLKAVVEVGAGIIQVGLALHDSLEGIRRAVEKRR